MVPPLPEPPAVAAPPAPPDAVLPPAPPPPAPPADEPFPDEQATARTTNVLPTTSLKLLRMTST
jgi:hypothetical protein